MSSEADRNAVPMKHEELAAFFEDMGMMIKSGISVSEAVTLLFEETEESDSSLHRTLAVMSDSLSSGSSLAGAMREAGSFPEYAVDMTDSSEYTGNLEATMYQLSDYYRRENSIRNTLTSAVRYPAILLVMLIAVLVVMLVWVFPAFEGVYSNLAGSLTSSSYSYLSGSFVMCRVLLVIAAVLAVILIAGTAAWKSGKKDLVRRMLSHFGMFRDLFAKVDLYRFTLCFEMFLAGGANMDDALEKSMPVAETEELWSKLSRCIEKAREGKSFSQTAYEENLYDRANNRMLIPAERSGMLDEIMLKITDNLAADIDKRVSQIADTIEPMLSGLLMICIGVMLISLMVPLIGIMNSMG